MFRFEFQHLLDQRQAIEERREMELAQAMKRFREEQGKLHDLREERERIVLAFYALMGKAVPAITPSLIGEAIRRKREEEEAQEAVCRKWGEEVEKRREALTEALKQKKIVEKLKERKFAEYLEMMKHREIKELDEAAALRYKGERA